MAMAVRVGTRDTYQKTLLRACVLAGDETSLARQLGVPASTVIDWLLGDKPVPVETFLVAVDRAH
jgi:DNA-binding transcriptional regulator YdaS (Cro superfamily)